MSSKAVSRPCACGEHITVLPPVTDERIRIAVDKHQSGPVHLWWRIEEAAGEELPKPLDAYETRLLWRERPTLASDDSSGGSAE